MAYKAANDMVTHNNIPCSKGLKQTDSSTVRDKPAPIKNKVSVKPDLAIFIKTGLITATAGMYVLTIMARINNPIK